MREHVFYKMEDIEILLRYDEYENKKICPVCEMENKYEYEFCELCGSELVECEEFDYENPYKQSVRIFIFLAVFFFILIVLSQYK